VLFFIYTHTKQSWFYAYTIKIDLLTFSFAYTKIHLTTSSTLPIAKMSYRRSPRIKYDSLLKGIGTIDVILNSKYNKKENSMTLLVAWVGIDGEYWTPIENLSDPIDNYAFLDPTTRTETLQMYAKYVKHQLQHTSVGSPSLSPE
jgi:hypothetical protein